MVKNSFVPGGRISVAAGRNQEKMTPTKSSKSSIIMQHGNIYGGTTHGVPSLMQTMKNVKQYLNDAKRVSVLNGAVTNETLQSTSSHGGGSKGQKKKRKKSATLGLKPSTTSQHSQY
jgi:NADP-dependent 3-hydroxy acid dehydrogenase YdfG